IPAGSALITGGLYLGCNRKSNCRQGFSRADVRRELSRPLNGYNILLKDFGKTIASNPSLNLKQNSTHRYG
ncbi:hypothetical protein KBZ15_16210, partial [Cyanobium sp. BA20m-p-22]|uniref:hypothetical protein n=1 Tax=Cyanobium sp. BA20m-p-22 TaxID=2823704 RepID=UPI0020CD3524